MIRNTLFKLFLKNDEKELFDKICEKCTEKTFKEHKRLFLKLKNKLEVKYRLIGALYSNVETRDIFLTNEEINLFKEGLYIIQEIEVLEDLIKQKKYRVHCDSKGLYKLLIRCDNINMLRNNINWLERELEHIKKEIGFWDNRNTNYNNKVRKNKNSVAISSLTDKEKSYLKLLSIDVFKLTHLSAVDLKKAYRKKAHELHPDKGYNLDDSKFKEINLAYESLKTIFV